ncbi:MAG: UvrB/UvrC motif-containing protein [Clostridium sp.]|uniref:UvrB/UvrC motif-containing protein n=1 Tax=Clostridium sp. TaxID=1506 RepID=UPI003F3A951B
MICEKCNKREAILNLSKIIDGESTSLWLCERCAKEYGKELFNDVYDEREEYASFNNVLSILFDEADRNDKKLEVECSNCRTALKEIKKGKLIGCEKCYNIFKKDIDKIVEKNNLYNEHKGVIPSKLGDEINIKRKINKLEKEMDIAVAIEAYEKAAEIRDEIRRLKGEGNKTEKGVE